MWATCMPIAPKLMFLCWKLTPSRERSDWASDTGLTTNFWVGLYPFIIPSCRVLLPIILALISRQFPSFILVKNDAPIWPRLGWLPILRISPDPMGCINATTHIGRSWALRLALNIGFLKSHSVQVSINLKNQNHRIESGSLWSILFRSEGW